MVPRKRGLRLNALKKFCVRNGMEDVVLMYVYELLYEQISSYTFMTIWRRNFN